MLNSLVRKFVSETRPRRVVDAFRHLGFGEFRGVDIANRDVVEPAYQVEGQFVLKIGTSVRYFAVQLCKVALVLVRALHRRQLKRRRPAVAIVRDRLAGAQLGEMFKAQINTDAALYWPRFGGARYFNTDIQEPVATRIACEVRAVFDLAAFRQSPREEHAKAPPLEDKSIAVCFEVTAFERDPGKRFLAAIAQVRTAMLTAALGVLLAGCVDRTGVQTQLLAAGRRQLVEIEAARPLFAPLQGVPLHVVAVIPQEIDGAGLAVKLAMQVFNAVAVDQDHSTSILYTLTVIKGTNRSHPQGQRFRSGMNAEVPALNI